MRILTICTLTTLVLCALKLTGYTAWGWAWVLAPVWVPFGAIIITALILADWMGWDGGQHRDQ